MINRDEQDKQVKGQIPIDVLKQFNDPVIIEKKIYEALIEQSVTDPLTGLYNRRYFDLALDKELTRAMRSSQNFSILFIDIDHFKKINDERGHDFGDELLLKVSKSILDTVRKVDVVARYGGDEFAILAVQTNSQGALLLGQRIMSEVSSIKMDGHPNITMSIGVATYPNHERTAKELLKRADQALYLSKRNGRNQINFYQRFGDQRRSHRYLAQYSGVLTHDHHEIAFTTQNISVGGMLIRAHKVISLGSLIQLTVEIENRKVQCVGTVLHISNLQIADQHTLGIGFIYLDRKDEKFLYDQVLGPS